MSKIMTHVFAAIRFSTDKKINEKKMILFLIFAENEQLE